MDINNILLLVGVLLLFPLSVVLLGEVILRLRSQGRQYASSVEIFRNVLLPLTAIYLLVTGIGGYDYGSVVSRVVLTAIIILGLVALMGVINGVLFERDAGSKVPKLFLDLGRILVVAFGVALTLSFVWGYNLSNLITALGVSSIVLGLALQEPLGNLFNGITLINERPFQVGDFIEVDGHAGRVVEVNWRAVRLLTRERDLIVLPHMKVSQSAIMNHSQPEERWAQKIMLGFSYDCPPNFVKRVMLEVCAAVPEIMVTPEPEVKVDDFADSAVIYEIEYYIANYGLHEDVKNDFMTRVWYAAKRNGIEIPFPQINLHREPQREKAAAAQDRKHEYLDYTIRMLGIPEDVEHLHDSPEVITQSFGEGEPVLDQGQEETGMYFLINGEVILQTQTPAGSIKQIAELHRGDFLTQLMLPGSRRNVVSAIATEDTEVVYFPEHVVRRLVNRYPKLAIQTEDIMATRRKQLYKVRGGTKLARNRS